jgi:uncharacterized membrane protein
VTSFAPPNNWWKSVSSPAESLSGQRVSLPTGSSRDELLSRPPLLPTQQASRQTQSAENQRNRPALRRGQNLPEHSVVLIVVTGREIQRIPVPGLVSAQATDVNNAGMVVGFNMTSTTTSEGFLDKGGVFTFLQFPGSMFTQALGLNNDSEIVGFFTDSAGNNHGFLYNIASGTYQQIDDPNAVGPGGTIINGINDNGQIVGFYTDHNNNTIGLVGTATTPEPGPSRRRCFCWAPGCSESAEFAAASPHRAIPPRSKHSSSHRATGGCTTASRFYKCGRPHLLWPTFSSVFGP